MRTAATCVQSIWSRPRVSARAALWLLLCGVLASCAPPEDPARVQLRLRLQQPDQMSPEELARVRGEVSKAIEGKQVRIKDGAGSIEMTEDVRAIVLGALVEYAGMFDEGLQPGVDPPVRILNSPGLSNEPEIEATRRLWIDVKTFEPKRFLFSHAFPGYGDYTYDLIVQ